MKGRDSGDFGDGPIGMFILSAFAKGEGRKAFSNSLHYDHSSTLKTLAGNLQRPAVLLGAAADPETKDLSDLFKGHCGGGAGTRIEDCRD